MNTEKTIEQAKLSGSAPHGWKGQIFATAKLHSLGNQKPYFSLTGEISTHAERSTGDAQICGCIHEQLVQKWPHLAPLAAIHLSTSDGEPTHAEANGFYHLAGAVDGDFGEEYHAGNSKRNFPCTPPADKPWQNTEYRNPTKEECVVFTADYLRVSPDEVRAILAECVSAFNMGAASVATNTEVSEMTEKARAKAGNKAAKARFAQWIETLRPRWQKDADEAIALIRSLRKTPMKRSRSFAHSIKPPPNPLSVADTPACRQAPE